MAPNPIEPAPRTPEEADLRRLARIGALVALLALAVLLAAIGSAIDWGSLSQHFTWPLLVERVLPQVPSVFYLFAVLAARSILDRVSEGQYFSARNIEELAELGRRLLLGAGIAIFIVPAGTDWAQGLFDYRVDFRPEPLVIGIIGFCLLVLGRLLLRAQQIEAEMEAIV